MKRAVIVTLLVSLACLSFGCRHTALLVTQYPEGAEHVQELIQALKDGFDEQNIWCDIYAFHMDTISHPTEIWRDERGKMAMMTANVYEPDIFFADGDDAARYFVQRAVDTHRKIIFLCVKGEPDAYNFARASNVTGVRELLPVREMFALMRNLVPSARRVAVLADRSLEGDAVLAQIEATEGLPIPIADVKRVGDVSEWMAAVQDFQTKADVLLIASYNSVLLEGSYDAVPPKGLLQMTSQANRLPDFSFCKDAVGVNGVMAAVAVPPAAQARKASELAARILSGDEEISSAGIEVCAEATTVISNERATLLGVKVPQRPTKKAEPPNPVVPKPVTAESK